MKILSIVGSLRKESYNRKIFNQYKEMADHQTEITEGKYDDFPLYNEDLHQMSFPESVENLAKEIRECDGLLFFSPEYNYSIPGPLKNAIDWLSRLKNQPFAGKPSSIVGASPGRLGTARMQYQLRQLGVSLDIHFMNQPEVMISEVNKIIDENGKITDEKTKKILQKHFQCFVDFTITTRESQPKFKVA